jgi:hypothetical protein
LVLASKTHFDKQIAKRDISPFRWSIWVHLSLGVYRKNTPLRTASSREKKENVVPEPRWSKRIAFNSSLQQLVMHGLEVSPGVAKLMEQSIKKHFEWINSVQIGNTKGGKPKVIIDLDLTAEFQKASPSFQHSSIYELMQTAASSVGWNMQRTALDFNGHLAQPLPNPERKQ